MTYFRTPTNDFFGGGGRLEPPQAPQLRLRTVLKHENVAISRPVCNDQRGPTQTARWFWFMSLIIRPRAPFSEFAGDDLCECTCCVHVIRAVQTNLCDVLERRQHSTGCKILGSRNTSGLWPRDRGSAGFGVPRVWNSARKTFCRFSRPRRWKNVRNGRWRTVSRSTSARVHFGDEGLPFFVTFFLFPGETVYAFKDHCVLIYYSTRIKHRHY